MKNKFYVLGSLLLFSFITPRLDSETRLMLGKRSCRLVRTGTSDKLAVFLSLHDDENTAVEAYMKIKSSLPSTSLLELAHTGERLLRYETGGKNFLFDPNRIFTESGILKTLKKYNQKYSKDLEYRVRSFSDSLLRYIEPKSKGSYIVAIHNNTNSSFSIKTYKNSKDATACYINEKEDEDNFFIVTEKNDYDYFVKLGRNVALQSIQAEDDGSLSVYCQMNKLPYINIEAERSQVSQQAEMIQETYTLLKTRIK